MKFGLDIHGTIDKMPKFFATFSQRVIANGHEVHIITGSIKTPEIEKQLKDLGIAYTHFFSVASYLIETGHTVVWQDNDNPWFDEVYWNDAKGKYCDEQNIDIHFDDSEEYKKYFTTLYVEIRN